MGSVVAGLHAPLPAVHTVPAIAVYMAPWHTLCTRRLSQVCLAGCMGFTCIGLVARTFEILGTLLSGIRSSTRQCSVQAVGQPAGGRS